MKKLLLLITVVLTTLTANARFAGNEGRGGGGTILNGRPQTFYSAGIVTGAVALTEEEVPQLTEMAQQIYQIPYLSSELKTKILRSIMPSQTREYYSVLSDYFDQATEDRLKAEYGRLTKQDPSTLVLFAVTDTESKTTYLLPNFYKLSPAEQKAILGHEGFWISKPSASYKTVLDVEYAYQSYFENPADYKKVGSLVSLMATDDDYLKFAIEFDRDYKLLDQVFKKGSIRFTNLLGKDYFHCLTGTVSNACNKYAYTHLFNLKMANPNSRLLPYLISKFDGNQRSAIVFGSRRDVTDIDKLKNTKHTFENFSVQLKYVCTPANQCGLAVKGEYSFQYNTPGKGAISGYFGQYTGGYTVTEKVDLINLNFEQY